MTKANLLSNHLQKTKHTASAVMGAVVCLVCVLWVGWAFVWVYSFVLAWYGYFL